MDKKEIIRTGSVRGLGLIDNWICFREMIDIIKHESRYIIKEPYKSLVGAIIEIVSERYTSIVSANSILYRARINNIDFANRDTERKPFHSEEMGLPPEYIAKSGRINPEGIPYLYCAGDLDTAAAELRPWKGANLTVGEVAIKKDILIADFTSEVEVANWEIFFDDFADMFSIQWPSELKLNYLVTQYFSECFKSVGIRGIKYKSEFNSGGNNYALFFKEDYFISKTYSVETCDISYIFCERGERE